MRLRVLALLLGVLVASVAVVGVAEAAFVTKASSKLSARVLPKHINPKSKSAANYKWNVKGGLTFGKYCPNGASVYPYCEAVPKSKGCSGKVTWYAKLGNNPALKKKNKKIGSGSTSIKSNCSYSFSKKFATSDFVSKTGSPGSANRHVGVSFFITFKGNSYVKGSSARKQTVIAKVLTP